VSAKEKEAQSGNSLSLSLSLSLPLSFFLSLSLSRSPSLSLSFTLSLSLSLSLSRSLSLSFSLVLRTCALTQTAELLGDPQTAGGGVAAAGETAEIVVWSWEVSEISEKSPKLIFPRKAKGERVRNVPSGISRPLSSGARAKSAFQRALGTSMHEEEST
jgi:hypothetical protein